MKHLLNVILLMWVLTPLLSAQVNGKAKLRFSVVSITGDSSKLQLSNGQLVQLKKRHPSKEHVVEFGEDRVVRVYKETASLTEIEEGRAEPLLSIKIPVGCRSANVLLLPGKEAGEYNVMFLSDSDLKKGGICFVNASKQDIGIILGGEKIGIKPTQKRMFHPDLSKPENKEVKMVCRTEGEEWKKFYSSVWRLVPSTREIMIFYSSATTGKVRVKGIADYTEEAKPDDESLAPSSGGMGDG